MSLEERLAHALGLGYRYLGRRERTEREIRKHLAAKDIGEEIVERAVAELQRQGYLDDAGFAERFTHDRRTLDEWGAERIERRLLELGVAPEHVAAAVGERGRSEEMQAALALLARRFPELADEPRVRNRAFGVLVRKGFESELAGDAVRAHARRAA